MTTPDLPSPPALEEIYRVAAELPAGERAAYLETVCEGRPEMRARIERMREVGGIAALLQQGSNETVPAEIAAELAGLKPEEDGELIGNYKLLQKIGEGGFGVVWMAEQFEPVRRRVALKILKLGMDTKEVIARFEQERQALAMMDHSNIAKVFDAGATPTGRPFFVMELVRGIKITDYCDQANLPTAERLALFIAVCHAVQHAHQKGIIHRDIKPSNILVTLHDGVPVPKVIDFGVAKATQSQRLTDLTLFTQFEQMIGTPLYMSPEQAEMSGLDIDTRSDIYSLGVLLYELLTGRTPFDPEELMRKGYDEIRRVIREQEPQKPSTALSTMAVDVRTTIAQHRQADSAKLLGLIRGDLDWIVMKALEKDRTRRYESASGLALDLQRHLQNEPVLARPPSFGYKAGKFVRKYRRGVIAAAAVLVAVLAGLVASTVLYLGKRDALASESVQRQKAEQHAQAETVARLDAEMVTFFLASVFRSPDPARDGHSITVAELLDGAAQKLALEFASHPEPRAKLQITIGNTYVALGLHRKAVPLFEEVRDYSLATFGLEHHATLITMVNLSVAYSFSDRMDEAIKLGEEVLALRRKVSGPEHPDTLWAMHTLATSYNRANRPIEARKLHEEVLALSRKVNGPEHPDTLTAMASVTRSDSDSATAAGRVDETVFLREEETLALSRKVNGPEHPDTLLAMNDLAASYEATGRRDEAIKLREEALTLLRKVSGPEHPHTLEAMHELAYYYADAGRREEALKLREEVVPLFRKVNGPEDRLTLGAKLGLADSYVDAGRRNEALKLREEVLPLFRKVSGPEHHDTLVAMGALASSYSQAGRRDEAINLHEEALALLRKVSGPEHPDTLTTISNLADTHASARRWDEAIKLGEEVLALRRKAGGQGHPKTVKAASALADLFRDANRLPEGEKVADDLLASLDENSHPLDVAAALRLRGGLRVRMRRWKDTAADYARAAPLNPDDHTVWYRLAPLLLHVGDAEGYRKHRLALLEKFRATDDMLIMERTAKACLLLPVEGEELEAAGRLADAAATLGKGNRSTNYVLFAEGLALYRRGKLNEAVSSLRDVLADPPYAALETTAHTVLAMALHRLDQPVEAREALAKASELVATKLPSLDTGDLGTNWQETLIAHLLLHEAGALLKAGDKR